MGLLQPSPFDDRLGKLLVNFSVAGNRFNIFAVGIDIVVSSVPDKIPAVIFQQLDLIFLFHLSPPHSIYYTHFCV